jgi:hypothetical protein
MKTFKHAEHWFQEKYDQNQTILDFVCLCLADMRNVCFIREAIREKHPCIESQIPDDITEDDLRKLCEFYIGCKNTNGSS